MSDGTMWFCFACNRTARADTIQVKFCYGCGSGSLIQPHPISSPFGQLRFWGPFVETEIDGFLAEYPGDVRYHPVSCEPMTPPEGALTLEGEQLDLLARVMEGVGKC